ncbi:MAG: hypothetical protein IPG97_15490 [Microthrixaceae bacterium]|nr:hypothetical protein [Microthrixaceae bacterium]
MRPGAVVMHPGPMNGGVEISRRRWRACPCSLILDQVTNGVAVRMAVLYLLLGAGAGHSEPRTPQRRPTAASTHLGLDPSPNRRAPWVPAHR